MRVLTENNLQNEAVINCFQHLRLCFSSGNISNMARYLLIYLLLLLFI